MFNWLFVLLGLGPADATPPKKDCVGVVAAEVAYAALLPSAPPVDKPVIDPKNCPTCKGAKRVPSGDGQGWTKCPTCCATCQPGAVSTTPEIKIPKSDPGRYKSSSTIGPSSATSK